MKVYIEEAGCDRRQLDVRTIRGYLLANGHELVDDPARADKILVSTCAFKKKEEDESVRRIRALREYGHPILIFGCLPDIAGERYPEFADLPFVAPRNIDTIDLHFEASKVPFSEAREVHVIERQPLTLARAKRGLDRGLASPGEVLERARAIGSQRLKEGFFKAEKEPYYLFICRGCLGSCSYCAIRRSVGVARSKPVEDVVAELTEGITAGYRTFVVLGDDPGCYGLDLSTSLPELLGELFDVCASAAAEAPAGQPGGPIRFRIQEIHPKFLVRYRDALLDLPGLDLVEEWMCPAQSGNDRVLKAMSREHTAADLLETMRLLRRRLPNAKLGTQIIVGFPTETEEEFLDTLEFVKAAQFDSVVVFPYHDKEGTRSSSLSGKTPDSDLQRRMRSAFRYFREAGIRAYYSCP